MTLNDLRYMEECGEERRRTTPSIDELESLADKMNDILMGYSGHDCAVMLRELIGRPLPPPNPHPPGTYLWAREECSRMRDGCVRSRSANWTVLPIPVERWDAATFPGSAFLATDWERVEGTPNPVGTFEWAEEQHAFGRSVRRKNLEVTVDRRSRWDSHGFSAVDREATDWEVVK